MIKINGKCYYSPYKPADKNFFKLLESTEYLLHPKNESLEQHMINWEKRWDLNHKLNEAKDIRKEHNEIEKELNLIINECEYELYQFDEEMSVAYFEIENILNKTDFVQR